MNTFFKNSKTSAMLHLLHGIQLLRWGNASSSRANSINHNCAIFNVARLLLVMGVFIGVIGMQNGYAQSIASLELGTTNFSGNTTGAVTFTSKNTNIATLPNVTLTNSQQGTAGGTGYISSSQWNTTTQDVNSYWSFTLTAGAAYKLSATSITILGVRSADGPTDAALRSDVDGYAANIGAVSSLQGNNSAITFSGLTLTNHNSITFRVYGWATSGGASSGTWRIGDGASSSLDIDVQGALCKAPVASIAPNAPVSGCIGQTLTLTGNPSAGPGAPYTYSWNGNAYSSTNTLSVSTTFTNTLKVKDASGCESNPVSRLVTFYALATATVSGGGTVCTPNPTPSISIALTGDQPWNIDYDHDGTPTTVTGITSSPYVIPTPAAGTYTVTAVSDVHNCDGTFSGSASVIVNPVLNASVSITSSDPDNTICPGESVTFTANPVNGGAGPTYIWKKNGVAIAPAETGSTYTTTTLSNGDAITVELTSNVTPCPGTVVVTSSSITTTVNPFIPASVTNTSNDADNTICVGTSVIFTANPTNGGAPTYVWYKNGSAISPAETGATYTTSSLANGDKIKVEMTSTASPCLSGSPAMSNEITMTVNALPTPTITGTPTISCSLPTTTLSTGVYAAYAWTPNAETVQTITANAATTYGVTVTDVNGCSATTTQLVASYGVTNTTTSTSYATIQAAITAASPNDVIKVCAGTYTEQVVINKAITLSGSQSGVDPRPSVGSARTIGGANESIIVAPKGVNVVNIQADNVIIDGFQITHSGTGGGIDAVKSTALYSNIEVKNNIVTNAGDEGIQLFAGNSISIHNNYVFNPIGDGINLSSSNPTDGTNQKILNNDISGSTSAYGSIYLYGTQNVEVAGNIINTKSSGISIGSGGLKVSNVDVHNNEINTELRTAYSAFAIGIGVDDKGDNIAIHNNKVVQVGSYSPPSNYDRYNLIRVGVDAASNPSNVSIHENYLERFDNQNYIYVIPSVTNQVNASCNWFNTTDPVQVAARVGGTGAISYNPFLIIGTDNDPSTGFTPMPGACAGCPGGTVTNTNTSVVYCTIQSAIDAATAGDVITVGAGTYPEILTVNKALTITGPNLGVNPNAPGRLGEAKITYPAGLSGYAQMMTVTADNVTIDGFTFDGKDYLSAAGTSGIIGYGNNIDIKNNIVSNFNYVSVWFSSYHPNYPTPPGNGYYRSDIDVENNYIHNADIFNLPNGSVLGYGIYMQGAVGSVTGNVVEDTKDAIQLQPYNNPNTLNVTTTVSNNTFEGYRQPMWFNYSENANARWSITNNTLTGIAAPTGSPVAEWVGLRVQYVTAVPNTLSFTGNTVNLGTANPTGRKYFFKKWGDVLVSALNLDATYAANTWKPSAVITDGTNILNPASTDVFFYSKIQNALDDAASGRTVKASDGTFAESLTFTKSVTLLGSNDAISPNTGLRNPESIIMPLNGTSVIGNANSISVTIKGFTIDQANSNVANGYFMKQTGKTATVWAFEKNVFQNGSDQTSSGNWLINGVSTGLNFSLQDNFFHHNLSSNGISIWGGNPVTIDIQKNVWEDNAYTALNLNSAQGIIKGNIFRETRTVDINDVGSFQSGILLANPGFNLDIAENEFYKVGYGVVFYASVAGPINVKNNLFDGTYIQSIRASNSQAPGGGSNLNDVVVTNNSFINYNGIGKNISNVRADNALLTTSCNWFESTDPIVVQSKVSTNVNVTPFLTDGTDDDLVTSGFQPVANSCNGNGPVRVYTDNTLMTLLSSHYKIQDAINAASSGNSIVADAGTYPEHVVVNKSLDIRGPNYGISGNSGSRVAEALIVPEANFMPADPWTEVVFINSSDVSFKGFKISGDNPAITGYSYAGMDLEKGQGVYSEGSNITFSNNIVEKGTTMGFYAGGTQSTQYQNLVIDNNKFDAIHDLGATGNGFGLYIQGTAGAITNNVVTNVRNGIELQPYRVVKGITTPVLSVNNNSFAAYRTGIYFNYSEVGASPWTIDLNNVTVSTPPAPLAAAVSWEGIRVETMYATANGGTLSNNTVDGTGATSPTWSTIIGMNYAGTNSNSPLVFFTNNTVSNVQIGFNHQASANIVFTGNDLSASQKAINVTGTFNIDATGGNTYNGQPSGSATLAQLFTIEDAINHKIDESVRGLVQVIPSQLYVTPNSFIAPATTTPLVQRGVDASSNGFTVNVAAGSYTESVVVNKEVTLLGANAGIACGSRGPAESIIAGTAAANGTLVNVMANNVTINGFKISNAKASFGVYNKGYSGLTVTNNLITDLGDAATGSAATYGVSIEMGSAANMSNVVITKNCINDIRGGADATLSGISAKNNNGSGVAIGVGFTNAGFDITGLEISKNIISGITANTSDFTDGGKGAYGVLINVGAKVAGVGKAVSPVVKENEISTLEGLWAHGVGLEGETPGASVINNKINGLTGHIVGINSVGVKVEENDGAATVAIHENSFVGVANGVVNATASTVNATCNWYGSLVPTTSGPVTYSPWLGNGTDTDMPTVIGFQPVPMSCTQTCSVTITQGVTVNPTCYLAQNGSIAVSVSGGSGSYQYAWDNLPSLYTSALQNITGLYAGDYHLTVTDLVSGCAATLPTVTLTQPAMLNGNVTGTATVAQSLAATTPVTFTATGGTAPYSFTYKFNGGSPITVPSPTGTLVINQSQLILGAYTYELVSFTDVNGCTGYLTPGPTTATVTVVTSLPAPDLSATIPEPLAAGFNNLVEKEGYILISNASVSPTTGKVEFFVYKPGNFTLTIGGSTSSITTEAPAVINVDNIDWDIVPTGYGYSISSKGPTVITGLGSIKIGYKLKAIGFPGNMGLMTVTILDNTGGATPAVGDSQSFNNQTVKSFSIN